MVFGNKWALRKGRRALEKKTLTNLVSISKQTCASLKTKQSSCAVVKTRMRHKGEQIEDV